MADLRAGRTGETHLVNGELYDEEGTKMTYKVLADSEASSGDNVVLALVSGKRIRVLHYEMQAAGTVVAAFQDNGAAVAHTPRWSFEAREGVVSTAPAGGFLFETGVGVGLDLNLSAAIAVDYLIGYVEAL